MYVIGLLLANRKNQDNHLFVKKKALLKIRSLLSYTVKANEYIIKNTPIKKEWFRSAISVRFPLCRLLHNEGSIRAPVQCIHNTDWLIQNPTSLLTASYRSFWFITLSTAKCYWVFPQAEELRHLWAQMWVKTTTTGGEWCLRNSSVPSCACWSCGPALPRSGARSSAELLLSREGDTGHSLRCLSWQLKLLSARKQGDGLQQVPREDVQSVNSVIRKPGMASVVWE